MVLSILLIDCCGNNYIPINIYCLSPVLLGIFRDDFYVWIQQPGYPHETSMKNHKILLYGANGFTARLMLEGLKALPIELILAGRNKEKIQSLAAQNGLEGRAFALKDQDIVAKNLADIDLLINCAGPFSETALPMAKAALKTGCHYFDITGEIGVFRDLHKLHNEAKSAHSALIPGLGFDIAPSDCLAKLVADRVKDPQSLVLAVIPKGTRPSHGTLKTALLGLGHQPRARRKGGIALIQAEEPRHRIQVNGRDIACVRAPLPDLFCAFFSTGIENIDTYLAMPPQMQKIAKLMPLFNKLKKISLFHMMVSKMIELLPNGPSEAQQLSGRAIIYAKAESKEGSKSAIMTTKEPYAYTADLIINATKTWLEKGLRGGFYTPSQAFGANFAKDACPSGVKIDFVAD